MRVSVDHGSCMGAGICAALAPEFFRLGPGQQAEVLSRADSTEPAVAEALASCPNSAIVLADDVSN